MKKGDTVYFMTGYCVHEMTLGEDFPPADAGGESTHAWLVQIKKKISDFARSEGLDEHSASLCFPRDRIANKSNIYTTRREALEALIDDARQVLIDAERLLMEDTNATP